MDPAIFFPYAVLFLYVTIVLLFLWLMWRIALALEGAQRAAERIAGALEERDEPPR